MLIRKAKPEEHATLTKISFESKGYWGYPSEYLEIWKDELTITKEYIQRNHVFIFEKNRSPISYYSIVRFDKDFEVSDIKIEKGYWLEHMFVLPEFIGQRVGMNMINHLKHFCEQNGVVQLKVLADPNSKEFYEKMGFEYQKEYPSTISGRTTPFLSIKL